MAMGEAGDADGEAMFGASPGALRHTLYGLRGVAAARPPPRARVVCAYKVRTK